MELSVTGIGEKAKIDNIIVSDAVFANAFKETLIHDVVVAYQANARVPQKKGKNRSAVSGGGKKPWRQKGTGNARAGTTRGPLWRSGGQTFGGQVANYKQKVNKKVYRAALRSLLSELIRQEKLIVIDELIVKTPKTSEFVAILKKFNVSKALFIDLELEENLYLASRNIPNVDVRDVLGIEPVSLLKYDNILVTAAAMKQIDERLQ